MEKLERSWVSTCGSRVLVLLGQVHASAQSGHGAGMSSLFSICFAQSSPKPNSVLVISQEFHLYNVFGGTELEKKIHQCFKLFSRQEVLLQCIFNSNLFFFFFFLLKLAQTC